MFYGKELYKHWECVLSFSSNSPTETPSDPLRQIQEVSFTLRACIGIQIWDVRSGQSGYNNYMHLSLLGEGGQNTFPGIITSLFILSAIHNCPVICRANIVITPILEMGSWSTEVSVTCQGHSLAEQGWGVIFAPMLLLSTKCQLLRKVVKVTVIYWDLTLD